MVLRSAYAAQKGCRPLVLVRQKVKRGTGILTGFNVRLHDAIRKLPLRSLSRFLLPCFPCLSLRSCGLNPGCAPTFLLRSVLSGGRHRWRPYVHLVAHKGGDCPQDPHLRVPSLSHPCVIRSTGSSPPPPLPPCSP